MEEKPKKHGVNNLCNNNCKNCKYLKLNFCLLLVYILSDIDIIMNIEKELDEINNNKNR